MMTSTIRENKLFKAGGVVFWLIIWEGASLLINEELFLPSPVRVAVRLVQLLPEASFWSAVFFTLFRILLGFLLSVLTASILASLSYRFPLVSILSSPLVKTVRATPVASIVILVLVWVHSRNLSVVISSKEAISITRGSRILGSPGSFPVPRFSQPRSGIGTAQLR